MSTRILYKNVPNKKAVNAAMAQLRKNGLNPGFTDAGEFSNARKGFDVYAVARKQSLAGFKAKKVQLSYL